MPRINGIYIPPAGTKAVPNTTILSAPYNALVDDLADDANSARPVTAGGTGATTASGARTNLGLAIGTNVQAYDAGLQSIAGLTTAADRMLYTTAHDVYATTALTPFARTVLGAVNAGDARVTLGVNDANGFLPNPQLPLRLRADVNINNVTDANDITESGWYRTVNETTNIPPGVGSGDTIFHIHVNATSGGNATQMTIARTTGAVYSRGLRNNVWTPWVALTSEGREITAGNGLTGGGDLSADRTIALGTPSTLTAATTNAVSGTRHTHEISLSADDVGAVPTSRTITAGNGLTGGGNLSANRTLAVGAGTGITVASSAVSVSFGTSPSTACVGNDARLSNSREWTASTVSQSEAQAGTATTRRAWTAQRVRQNAAAITPGVGQTWQNVFSSRARGTSYQNTFDRSIRILIGGSGSGDAHVQTSTDNSNWINIGSVLRNAQIREVWYDVPPGHYYRVEQGTVGNLNSWWELR